MIEISGCCDFCGKEIFDGDITNFVTVYFDPTNRMDLRKVAFCKDCLSKVTGESGAIEYQLENLFENLLRCKK